MDDKPVTRDEILAILNKFANHKYNERITRFKSAADIPEDLWPCISRIEFKTGGTEKGLRIKLYDKKKAQKLLKRITKGNRHG